MNLSFPKLVDILPVMGIGFGFEIIPEATWIFIDFLCYRFVIDYGKEENE